MSAPPADPAEAAALLDLAWERLAEAVTTAGEGRERLFLAKLALLMAREIADPARLDALVAEALRDLD
jgi:hypothetical protein